MYYDLLETIACVSVVSSLRLELLGVHTPRKVLKQLEDASYVVLDFWFNSPTGLALPLFAVNVSVVQQALDNIDLQN